RLLAVAVALLASFTLAPSARAGAFVGYVCKSFDGVPAPIDGWSQLDTNFTAVSTRGNSCPQGGAGNLSVNFDTVTPGVRAGAASWQFEAPANLRFTRASFAMYTVVRPSAGDNGAYAATAVYPDGIAPNNARFATDSRLSNDTQVQNGDFAISGIDTRYLAFSAGCYLLGPNGTCGTADGPRAQIAIGSQAYDFVDDFNPTIGQLSGTLVASGKRRGTETLKVPTADRGSGVWTVEVKLGSTVVVGEHTFNDNGGRCVLIKLIPGTTANEFRAAQPCALSAEANLSIDTTKVADGAHVLTVTVRDASKNTVVSNATAVTVDNSAATPTPAPAATTAPVANPTPKVTPAPGATPTPAPNAIATPTPAPNAFANPTPAPRVSATPILGGPSATNLAGTLPAAVGTPTTAKLTVTAPKAATPSGRALVLAGTLLDGGGKPIGGAPVDVFERVALAGAPTAKSGAVTTGADGTFRFTLTPRASRTVEFAYAPVPSGDYLARAEAAVVVSAAVSLKAPGTGRIGRTVAFTGTVGVDPLPAKGARVVIESQSKKRWLPAAIVRTDSAGRFSWKHAFRTRGTFTMRARVLSSLDVPARRGTSPKRTLRVR
ncbi:MAG: hypothetical protein Q7T55_01340, partial [Solirubrobacteraceae bacterium]|nr:hypothetical protein [Solirubrobacteraceae bacterium]